MPDKRPIHVLLSLKSRLLREMIRQAFSKIPDFQVVGESLDQDQIQAIINEHGVQWIVVDFEVENGERKKVGFTENTMNLLTRNPAISLLGIAMNGSYLQLKWLELQEEIIFNPSVNGIVKLMRSNKEKFVTQR